MHNNVRRFTRLVGEKWISNISENLEHNNLLEMKSDAGVFRKRTLTFTDKKINYCAHQYFRNNFFLSSAQVLVYAVLKILLLDGNGVYNWISLLYSQETLIIYIRGPSKTAFVKKSTGGRFPIGNNPWYFQRIGSRRRSLIFKREKWFRLARLTTPYVIFF